MPKYPLKAFVFAVKDTKKKRRRMRFLRFLFKYFLINIKMC